MTLHSAFLACVSYIFIATLIDLEGAQIVLSLNISLIVVCQNVIVDYPESRIGGKRVGEWLLSMLCREVVNAYS